MMIMRLVLAVGLMAVPLGAAAQPYPYADPYQTYRPRTPPSWSYDPYTSGQAPCPQKGPWDTQTCSQIMPPTYGQPSYWSR